MTDQLTVRYWEQCFLFSKAFSDLLRKRDTSQIWKARELFKINFSSSCCTKGRKPIFSSSAICFKYCLAETHSSPKNLKFTPACLESALPMLRVVLLLVSFKPRKDFGKTDLLASKHTFQETISRYFVVHKQLFCLSRSQHKQTNKQKAIQLEKIFLMGGKDFAN